MAITFLNSAANRNAYKRALCWLASRRMARFSKRKFYREFFSWWKGTDKSFNILNVLGQDLNDVHDDELYNLTALMGQIGCLSESVSNVTIYVDPISGSDVEGSGTATNPYASFWFLTSLPRIINHEYRIILLNDLTVNEGISLNIDFGLNGSLAIVGGVVPTVVSGPWIETNIAPADGASWLYEITANGVWADDAHWGDYVQWLTGGATGLAAPIHMMLAPNLIRTFNTGGPVVPNDTFQIIRPTVTLRLNQGFVINARGPNVASTVDWGESRVFLGNLNIDIQNSNRYEPIQLNGPCLFAGSFLRIITKLNVGGMSIQQAGYNGNDFWDETIELVANTGINNFATVGAGTLLAGTIIISSDGPSGIDISLWLINNLKIIRAIDVRGTIFNDGTSSIMNIAAGMLYTAVNLWANYLHLDGYPNEFCVTNITDLHLEHTHFSGIFPGWGAGGAAGCIRIHSPGITNLEACTATAPTPFTDVGIDIESLAQVRTRDDPATLIGTLGAVRFKIAGIIPHPVIVDTSITDLNGSWETWI